MRASGQLRVRRRCYAALVSDLSPDIQDRLRAIARRYQAPSRRPHFFLVLYGLIVLLTLGALLGRLGTPWARALGTVIIVVPALLLALSASRASRSKRGWLDAALRAVRSVDATLSARLGRAARLVVSTTQSTSGESAELSRYHLDGVLAGVSLTDLDQSARRRGRSLGWLALGLLALIVLLAFGRTLSIVEGLDVLLARRGTAPFEIAYLEESVIEAQLPLHVGGANRKVPVYYEAISLPAGSEITWRMIPRVLGREFVVTDGIRDVPFVSDGQGAWVARLRVDDPSEVRVAAKFGDVKVLHGERLRVDTILDREPTVALLGGPREVKISELERLPVEFVAQDDYGLSLVELVIRSGDKQERQELARLDGARRSYRGATALTRKTPLVEGAYQPVVVTVEARDGDLVTGPRFGKSEPIVLIPEPIGESLAQRHLALRAFRRAVVDYQVESQRAQAGPSAARAPARQAALAKLTRALDQLQNGLEKSAEPPRGSLQFLRAQLASLGRAGASTPGPEAVLLATDVLLAELAASDAERLSQDLGDVVAELGARVHAAQASEIAPKQEDLLASLLMIERGAMRLQEVGTRGLDLGSVARADLARARRLLEAKELSRAAAALAHLAARLRRATPSFGSKHAGVESGGGSGSAGSDGPLSRAPSEYDKLGERVRSLAEQHAQEQTELEQLLEDAARAAESDAGRNENLNRVSAELRESLEALPNFGRIPGSALAEASQARSQGESMADALDAGQLDRALQAGRAALEALERAQRANEAQGGYLSRDDLEQARAALERAQAAAQQAQKQKPSPALGERGKRQRELGRAALELAEQASHGQAPLPEAAREALHRAGQLMQDAGQALERGEAQRGRELSADAQEALEAALPERRQADAHPAEEGDEAGDSEGQTEGHADVPGQAEDRSRAFRQRVEAGLGRETGRFGPAVRRYAETLK